MNTSLSTSAQSTLRATAGTGLVDLAHVRAAARRLGTSVVRTPLLYCEQLSEQLGCRILVKAENLQHTGSFKVRGALNALRARGERGELTTGVVTFSAGNHGAAVAYAARRLGLRATVCMPPGAVTTKVDAVRRYHGNVVFTEDLIGTATELVERTGEPLLHPFDDADVIAGQATVGLEIIEDTSWVDLVVIPVGGGGLISGVGSVFAALSAGTRVAGVEPAGAPTLGHAVRVGSPGPLPHRPVSIADGLTSPISGVLTYAHVRRHVHHLVEVAEPEIRDAWARLVSATKLLVEPSAAVSLAAIESGLLPVPVGATVVLVISGGNTTITALGAAAAQS
ncbi:MAG TPA: threonine/serine dehydratase [Pseudonocardiaceae bacterium]|jgi:threonine dehydratase|nr:threonine/serine dehydratase [Pseudonocardiaceae bacterium]